MVVETPSPLASSRAKHARGSPSFGFPKEPQLTNRTPPYSCIQEKTSPWRGQRLRGSARDSLTRARSLEVADPLQLALGPLGISGDAAGGPHGWLWSGVPFACGDASQRRQDHGGSRARRPPTTPASPARPARTTPRPSTTRRPATRASPPRRIERTRPTRLTHKGIRQRPLTRVPTPTAPCTTKRKEPQHSSPQPRTPTTGHRLKIGLPSRSAHDRQKVLTPISAAGGRPYGTGRRIVATACFDALSATAASS